MRTGALQSNVVCLVAHEPDGSEHLGVRYVAAALRAAGFAPLIVPLCTFDAMAEARARVLAAQPLLVGLSISDAVVAPLMLTFARLLRESGFAGHLTTGGPLATLLRRTLLAEQPALDSVIRHDGELAAVMLAQTLAGGMDLASVPGLTTRVSDGQPNPRLPLHAAMRPLRKRDRAKVFGLACADVAASRGCAGACPYCGVAALERDARQEAAPSATSHPARGARKRSANDVAAEIVQLQREHDVRIVRLVDDNLLGADPGSALSWLRDLRRGLNARAAKPMALRLMVDPRVLSREVAAALADLGVVQALVGLESLTDRGLRQLGRPGSAAQARLALDHLVQADVAPFVNVLALRPGGTLDEARAEIAGLPALDHVAWDVLPVVVNPGTDLAHELDQRGELAGAGLGISWLPADPALQRALYAVERLRVGGLAWLSRPLSLPDLDFALRAGLRCGLPGFSQTLVQRGAELLRCAQVERRRILERALAMVETEVTPTEFGQAVEALVGELNLRLVPVEQGVSGLLQEVRAGLGTEVSLRTDFLRPTSSLLAATLFVALSASCNRNALVPPPHAGADAGASGADVGALLDTRLATERRDSGTDLVPARADTRVDVSVDAVPDGQRNPEPDGSVGPEDLAGQDAQCDTTALWGEVTKSEYQDRCRPDPSLPEGSPQIVVDDTGRVVDNTGITDAQTKQAWLDSLAQSRWPCLAGQSIRYQCLVLLIY
jgi:hypothetical protein